VFNLIKSLEQINKIEATYIQPSAEKIIETTDVIRAIKKNTILISLIYVSNETGAVNDIKALGTHLQRLKQKIYLHTDATQAIKYHNCNVEKLNIDLMSFCAHKIYGPKGIGALYIKSGTPIAPQIIGGSQENGFRAGTQNVTAALGFAEAVKQLKTLDSRILISKKILKLKNLILTELSKYKNIIINTPTTDKSTSDVVSISIPNKNQDQLLYQFDQFNICVSAGSACNSGSSTVSHVISALNPKIKRLGTVRITLGQNTKPKELKQLFKAFEEILK
jgi:cysteine desulfurase